MSRTRHAQPPTARELAKMAWNPSYRAPRAADLSDEANTRRARQAPRASAADGISSGRGFLAHGSATQDVKLVAVQPFMNELAHSAHMRSIRRLDLSGNRIGAAGIKALAASPQFTELRELGLNGNDLGAEGARELHAAAWFQQLTALELADNRLGSADARLLLECLPGLGSLDLSRNPLDAEARFPPQLHHLRLASCGLPFATLPDSLVTLDLSRNVLGPSGTASLVNTHSFSTLLDLDLSFNDIEDAGANALAQRLDSEALEVLTLRGNRITNLSRFIDTDRFGFVKALDLSSNPLGDAAVVLVRSDALASLERLNLACCDLTDAGLLAFTRSGALGGLTMLSLAWNRFHDVGVKALAACPDLAGLVHLDLTGTALGFAGAVALAESPYLVRLRTLVLGENHRLPADAAMMLHERFGRTAA